VAELGFRSRKSNGGFKMNQYIERYIYAVTRLIKPKERREVQRDLTEYFESALGGDESFTNVEKTLKAMGSPRKLAYKYRNNGKNLIKQENYELYLDVVKIGLGIVAAISFVTAIIDFFSSILINPSLLTLSYGITSIVRFLFDDLLRSLLVIFASLTIGFMLWERYGHHLYHDTEEWMIKDLPRVPSTIRPFEKTSLEMITTTLATVFLSVFVLLVLRFPLLANELGIESSILLPINYNTYFFVFLLLVGQYIINQVLLISKGRTLVYKISRSVFSMALLVTFGLFFFGGEFFSESDKQNFANLLDVSFNQATMTIFLTLFITISIMTLLEIKELISVWKK
jgi:hypothetical protein